MNRWRRHIDPLKASRKANTANLSSQFCSAYPDQGSDKKHKGKTRGGNFQQLRQVKGAHFKKSTLTQVVEMFSWEDSRVLKRLKQKKLAGAPATLVDRQQPSYVIISSKNFSISYR
jgi:hypothetical protein